MKRTLGGIMRNRKTISDAVTILHQRYVGNDRERKASMEEERVNAEVARIIYDLRTKGNLSQKELAGLVGTSQSVISRLEDADYGGHSLNMLVRIASVLDSRLTVSVKQLRKSRQPRSAA